ALECAQIGIRVNTVNPGQIDTRMIRALEEQMIHASAQESKETILKTIPMRRYGTPNEVALLMLFLASDESRFCTGGVYMVDGGGAAG
ncbi:MAG: SDR family oxidoreductase, partial [Deltaproteobacteria bacterium]|nr:SDR family oxidoreductase [Deltaproteobacteria bacterium]